MLRRLRGLGCGEHLQDLPDHEIGVVLKDDVTRAHDELLRTRAENKPALLTRHVLFFVDLAAPWYSTDMIVTGMSPISSRIAHACFSTLEEVTVFDVSGPCTARLLDQIGGWVDVRLEVSMITIPAMSGLCSTANPTSM